MEACLSTFLYRVLIGPLPSSADLEERAVIIGWLITFANPTTFGGAGVTGGDGSVSSATGNTALP